MKRLLGSAALGVACMIGTARAMPVLEIPVPAGLRDGIIRVDGHCGGP